MTLPFLLAGVGMMVGYLLFHLLVPPRYPPPLHRHRLCDAAALDGEVLARFCVECDYVKYLRPSDE